MIESNARKLQIKANNTTFVPKFTNYLVHEWEKVYLKSTKILSFISNYYFESIHLVNENMLIVCFVPLAFFFIKKRFDE